MSIKLFKVTVILVLTLVSFSTTVFAKEAEYPDPIKDKIIFITDNEKITKEVLVDRKNSDVEIENLMSEYDITYTSNIYDQDISISDSVVISWEDALSEYSRVREFIREGKYVYIFGEKLESDLVEEKLGDKNKTEAKKDPKFSEKADDRQREETKWDIIGLNSEGSIYFSKVQSYSYDSVEIEITPDIILQEVFRSLTKIKSNQNKIKNKQISILSYSTDTIVKAEYDLASSYYAQNASGVSILRATLNTDYILKQNLSNDIDPTYDYFYLRDNVELSCPNGSNCASFRDIDVEHWLRYPSSDNLIDWGPDATNNVSGGYVTVGLPWAVSWTFIPSASTTDISISGGQTTDRLHWEVYNEAWTGIRYELGNPTRFQPGTAWASSGTLASIYIDNYASIRYGANEYSLEVYKLVEYDY